VNEDYLAYWGLSKSPFSLTPDPSMLYLSKQHSECIMRLKYAIFSHKGGALLVSDNAGNGKTSVLALLKKDLNEYYSGRVRVVFIDHPTLTPIEMIGEIAHQLGNELHTTEKIRALNYLRDRLFALYNENIKVVVIVDEGQMLKDRMDLLGELRILLNFCVSDAFLLTFIFSGQKPLDSILREMPEFWQRLPVRFFLRNLDFEDTKALIDYRLQQVGASYRIFTDDAVDSIYAYSDGCPRVICSVADLCLIVGYARGVKKIGFVEASTACRDMESSGDGFHYYTYLKTQHQPQPKPEQNAPSDAAAQQRVAGAEETVRGKGVSPVEPIDEKSGKDELETEQIKEELPLPEPVVHHEEAQADTHEADISPAVPVEPAEKPHPETTPKIRAGDPDALYCPACSEPNDRDDRFCASCGSALYRKCPACSSLIDTISNECPMCHADVEKERVKLLNAVRESVESVDILDDGVEYWLKANNVVLADGEKIVIVFPRGNILRRGPKIVSITRKKTTATKSCDVILTDQRIILCIGETTVSSDYRKLTTCSVSDSGKLVGNRHALMVSFDDNMYRISLPFKSKKSKQLLDRIGTYIKQVMLS